MSHFSVLVIGPDVDAQLAPYHEFECTGTDDQYVQDVDVTAKVRENGADYYGLKEVSDESEVDTGGEHKFGYAIVEDGVVVKAVHRTNLNAKWDWYQTGGRWTGYFKLKTNGVGELGEPGLMTPEPDDGTADVLRKKDVDVEGMRDEAGQKAGEQWDKVHAVIKGRVFVSWKQMVDANGGKVDDALRDKYHAQPAVADLNAAKLLGWGDDPERYLVSREVYVQNARDNALAPFAFVKDGKWYERGEMGWWACVSNEKDEHEWAREFNKMFDALPDNTLLTAVDCHI